MAKTGRPKKEFDKKAFSDLVGLGCNQEEICWYFRDETGKTANIDTLTRWCKRTFGMTFQEYFKQNGFMALKIQLRRNQFELSKKSAAMAIFLGKQYLGQTDHIEVESSITDSTREEVNILIDELNKATSSADIKTDTV
jgi:methylphosphotriester-DNA--protein-cysteine methyltransferase